MTLNKYPQYSHRTLGRSCLLLLAAKAAHRAAWIAANGAVWAAAPLAMALGSLMLSWQSCATLAALLAAWRAH